MIRFSETFPGIAQKSIAWFLLFVLTISVLALGGNRPVVWTLMSLTVLILFCAQILLDVIRPRPLPLDRLWLPALLFLSVLIWGLLQRSAFLPDGWAHPAWDAVPSVPGHVSADPVRSGYGVIRLAAYGTIFWIAVRAGELRVDAYRYLKAFALFSTGLAVFGFYSWGTGRNPILGDLAASDLSASFVNRNNYATFAIFGALANLAIYSRSASEWQRQHGRSWRDALEGFFAGGWIWAFGMILCGGALLTTQSRAGALAGVIGLLAFLAAFRSGRRSSSTGLILVVVGAMISVGLTASVGLVDRLLTTTGEEGRFLVFPFVIEGIGDRPWLGHGLGAFADAFRAYVPPAAAMGEWDMAHNSYLENAFELGLPAATALYAALGLVTWRIWRGLSERARGRPILAFVLACIAAAGFHAAFDFSLQMPALTGSFVFLLGLGYAQSFPERLMRPRKARRTASAPLHP